MATQTLVLGVVADSSGEARLEADWDDTSNVADPDLIVMRVVNGMSRPCYVSIRRSNQAQWFEVVVPASSTRTQNAGGPVRRMSDLPFTMLTTR